MKIALFSTTQREYGNLVERELTEAGYDVSRIFSKSLATVKSKVSQANFDIAVVAYYGAIIPQEIIDLFPRGMVNIHPSLLPKYRGPSPAASAILNGDKITGVTIFLLDAKMDHGPILAQRSVPIRPKDNRHTLLIRLFSTGAKLLVKILPDYLSGKLKPVPQDHTQATYTRLLTKEDGRIDWNKPNELILRQIRALQPWPGSWTQINHKRILIHKAHLDPQGNLIIDQFQVAGKTPVKGSWEKKQFLAYLGGRKNS